MEITIFESVVIESALSELEAEGVKYDGLYVDMNNAPERKYVKDKASLIATLKKKVERVRIDAAKSYKAEVEKQAFAIHERLDAANSNFQVLIDEYNLERKKILDAEKARKQAILDAAQFDLDHEMGLLINKTYEFDKAEELRKLEELRHNMKVEAERQVAERQKQLNEKQEQDKINAENARLANVEYVRGVNRAILDVLEENDIGTEAAMKVIKLAAKGLLPQLTINY